jgi:hypothetical protein
MSGTKIIVRKCSEMSGCTARSKMRGQSSNGTCIETGRKGRRRVSVLKNSPRPTVKKRGPFFLYLSTRIINTCFLFSTTITNILLHPSRVRTVDREHRLDVLRRRKRRREEGLDEEEDASAAGAAAAAAAAAIVKGAVVVAEPDAAAAPRRDQPTSKGKDEETVDAVAQGAARGLDNKGLIIPPDKMGYVKGQQHKGHVNLFGQVAEQLGACTIYSVGRAGSGWDRGTFP